MSSVNHAENRFTTHPPNLRELHQLVTDMLQEISSSSPSLQSKTDLRNIGVSSSQISSSPRDSLSMSSLSPPTSPGSYNPSPRNSDLYLNNTKTSGETTPYAENNMTERNSQNLEGLTLPLNRLRLGNEPVTALSPISEGIPSKSSVYCGSSRGVSAAVSDESVAADSGVFVSSMENLRRQNSMRSTGQCSDEDAIESPQIKIGLGYVEEKEQLLVFIEEACSLPVFGASEGCGIRVAVSVLPTVTGDSVHSTKVCKDLIRPVFSTQFFVSIPKVRLNILKKEIHYAQEIIQVEKS